MRLLLTMAALIGLNACATIEISWQNCQVEQYDPKGKSVYVCQKWVDDRACSYHRITLEKKLIVDDQVLDRPCP